MSALKNTVVVFVFYLAMKKQKQITFRHTLAYFIKSKYQLLLLFLVLTQFSVFQLSCARHFLPQSFSAQPPFLSL